MRETVGLMVTRSFFVSFPVPFLHTWCRKSWPWSCWRGRVRCLGPWHIGFSQFGNPWQPQMLLVWEAQPPVRDRAARCWISIQAIETIDVCVSWKSPPSHLRVFEYLYSDCIYFAVNYGEEKRNFLFFEKLCKTAQMAGGMSKRAEAWRQWGTAKPIAKTHISDDNRNPW